MNPIPSFQSCCDGCLYHEANFSDVQWVAEQMLQNPQVLREYLARGNDPNAIVSNDKENLLTVAVSNNKLEAIQLLIQYGANLDPKILNHAYSARAFELLADAGATIKVDSIDRYTRLLRGSDPEFIYRLKGKGADIDYIEEGNTTLMHLAQGNKLKPLQAMLKAGANVNIKGIYHTYTTDVSALDIALIVDAYVCACALILHDAPFLPSNKDTVAALAATFRSSLQYRELHGRFPPHMRRPVGNPFPINPFIQNCED